MNSITTLYESHLTSLPLIGRGKVRDLYKAGPNHYLIVTCDRLSAFDVILSDAIPNKGKVLTEMSMFWFNKLAHIIQNHTTKLPLENFLSQQEIKQLGGRGMLVKKLNPLPIEAVVRGYLIGSGWEDYKMTGNISGVELPKGLQQAEKLAQPIFTPATKAQVGDHDENISFNQCTALIGSKLAEQVKQISIELYQQASDYAESKGIIIADTKFEFGLDDSERLILIDEALTPDSSRFWPKDKYRVGTSPVSYDKQFVRDYLNTLEWDKTPPAPALPQDIITKTSTKYQEALLHLTG